MSFRNGDKARSGRLRKQRNQMRLKTRALRAALIAPAGEAGHEAGEGAPASGSVVKSAAVKIGSTLGKIVSATHLASPEA